MRAASACWVRSAVTPLGHARTFASIRHPNVKRSTDCGMMGSHVRSRWRPAPDQFPDAQMPRSGRDATSPNGLFDGVEPKESRINHIWTNGLINFDCWVRDLLSQGRWLRICTALAIAMVASVACQASAGMEGMPGAFASITASQQTLLGDFNRWIIYNMQKVLLLANASACCFLGNICAHVPIQVSWTAAVPLMHCCSGRGRCELWGGSKLCFCLHQ